MKSSSIWLLVIVTVAFVLRAWSLSAQCLDIDEYSELQLTKLSYSEAAFAADSMPPLFPVMHKALHTVLPIDFAGRWLSLAFGVASVWLVGTLWARAFGPTLALMTAALLAISPLHIYYSQYIRSYGLMMFWAVFAIGAIAIAVQSRRKSDWLLFGLSASGGLYTHYYFAIFLAVLSLTFALHAYGWQWSREWWITNLCIGVLALPLIGFVGKDLHFQKSLRDSRPLDIASFGYTYASMLTGYSVGPSKRDLQVLDRREAVQQAAPVAAVVGSVFLLLGTAGLHQLRKLKLLGVTLALAFLPVMLVGLLGYIADVTFNPRFVVWSLPPLLLLIAAGVLQVGNSKMARVGVALLVTLSVIAVYNRQFVAKHQNEDVRSLGAYLEQKEQGNLPVFVLSNYMTPAVAHYLADDWQVLELPKVDDVVEMQPSQTLPQLAMDAIDAGLPRGGGYWLVYTREFHGDPGGEIFDMLSKRHALEKAREFAGIILYRGHAPTQ